MTNASNALRSLFAYVFLIPLALVLGYLLATSNLGSDIDLSSLGPILLLFGLMSVPLLLRCHRPLLLLTLNTNIVVFFVPGTLPLWFLMVGISLALAIAQRALDRDAQFVHAPSATWPLLYIAAIVVLTGFLTGGFGSRAFGSGQYGGKRYLYIFAAIGAYFCIISRPIPPNRALLYIGLYFLGGLVNLMSNIIPLLPREFYWLALIFPVSSNDLGSLAFEGSTNEGIARFFGLTTAGCCVFYYLLARFGIRDMLSGAKLGRFLILVAVMIVSMFGGFRSALILLLLLFALVFYFEGLLRTKYSGILVGAVILSLVALLPLADRLPLSIQRSLSFLPLNINPVARYEAEASSAWRLGMWEVLLPEVPKYFFTPKGMGIDGSDLELTGELARRGLAHSQDVALLAGDYHNGPLSVLIPFGIWGFLGWMWFLVASVRALWLNHRYGPEGLRKVNTLLLAYFLARAVIFFTIFGGFFTDLVIFTTTVGLSLSLNNGVCKPSTVSVAPEPESDPLIAESNPA